MRQDSKVSYFTVLLVVVVVSAACVGAIQQQKQPQEEATAAEPYSFAYTADSLGGQSSHQESGDGNGRVTGFYTIRGEDGRERRVDYVADENGYRATVRTNEVGTRSESTADAQYEVELPSAGQLEAAKVSLEQYKYLEDVHAEARERFAGARSSQVEQTSQNAGWRQQQQQQPFINNFAARGPNQQLLATTTQLLQPQNSQFLPVPSQATTSGSITSTTSADFSEVSAGQTGSRRLRDASDQAGPVSSSETSSASTISQQALQQQPVQGKLLRMVKLQAGADQPNLQSNQQRINKQLWTQSSSSSGRTGSRLVNPSNRFLQQQLEQQFMLQANQLTNQDYPRQVIQQQSGQAAGTGSGQQLLSSTGSQTSAALRQAPLWLGSVSEGQTGAYEQQGGDNNVFGQQADNQLAITQQQTNIINEPEYEVAGELPAPQQQVVATGLAVNTTKSVVNTSNQLLPTGLVSINLSNEQEEQVQTEQPQPQAPQVSKTTTEAVQQQQQQQQEQVLEVPSEAPQQVEVNSVKGQQDQQNIIIQEEKTPKQVIQQQEPIQRRPDSIKQIIETVTTRQPALTTSSIFVQQNTDRQQDQREEIAISGGGGGYEYQNQNQGQTKQVTFSRPATTVLVTPSTRRPEIKQTVQWVETPTTTTTSWPKQPIISYQQSNYTASIRQPEIVVVEQPTSTARPQQVIQVGGVKGGSKVSSSSSWQRQREQTQRFVPSRRPQTQQVVQQQTQWSITAAPTTRRPTQPIPTVVETTLSPEPSSTQRVITAQVDYASNNKQPEQQSNYQQDSLQQNNRIEGSKQVLGQGTKGGSKRTSGRQFWSNNGAKLRYSNQGSYSPSRSSDSYSSFGDRVTAVRTIS